MALEQALKIGSVFVKYPDVMEVQIDSRKMNGNKDFVYILHFYVAG